MYNNGLARKDAISRCVKNTLSEAGINIQIFPSYSCRLSGCSKAKNIGADLDNILKIGCWCQQTTYPIFCSKELEYMDKNNRIAETIVSRFKNKSL